MSREGIRDIPLNDAVPFKVWWVSGGKGRPPSWQGYIRMTRERNEQKEAQIAIKQAKREAQDAFKQQWSRQERARGLRRWHREHRESQAVVPEDAEDQDQVQCDQDQGDSNDGDGGNTEGND